MLFLSNIFNGILIIVWVFFVLFLFWGGNRKMNAFHEGKQPYKQIYSKCTDIPQRYCEFGSRPLTIKQVMWIFWFPGVHRSYVYTKP